MALLLLHAAPAFFTPPHGEIPHSADPTTGETEEVGERMTYAFGVSTTGRTANVALASLWRNSWGNLVAESYETDRSGRVTKYTANSNLAAASSFVTRDAYTFNTDTTADEVSDLEWFKGTRGESNRAKAEITGTMWEDVKLIKIGKRAVVKLHQLHFAMCYRLLGSGYAAPYAAGTDMLVNQMQAFINDEAGGGCSEAGCTADQFEWATDRAAEAYLAGGGSVPTEDVVDFLLACAQEMGYEGVVPASISA